VADLTLNYLAARSDYESSQRLNERLAAAKDNAVLQAQIWAAEARGQRATVLEILRYFGLPEHDWEALRLIKAAVPCGVTVPDPQVLPPADTDGGS
jgi:hypothetical protein